MSVIIVNDPQYTPLQRKLISLAFDRVKACNAENKSRHVSFLLKRNKIVSTGINNERCTHPKAHKWGYYCDKIHSELAAIIRFPYPACELSRYDLYNIRINRSNEIVLAKPCKHCMKLIGAYQINRCIYTDDNGVFQELF